MTKIGIQKTYEINEKRLDYRGVFKCLICVKDCDLKTVRRYKSAKINGENERINACFSNYAIFSYHILQFRQWGITLCAVLSHSFQQFLLLCVEIINFLRRNICPSLSAVLSAKSVCRFRILFQTIARRNRFCAGCVQILPRLLPLV